MSHSNSEYESNKQELSFLEKMSQLLPNIEFEETAEMHEARMAILEAARRYDQGSDSLRSVWIEYAVLCEQEVDRRASTTNNSTFRMQLQIASLVHKALIYREAGDRQRYLDELAGAKEYAFHEYLDEISEAIDMELRQA